MLAFGYFSQRPGICSHDLGAATDLKNTLFRTKNIFAGATKSASAAAGSETPARHAV